MGVVQDRPDELSLQMSGDKGISAFPESDNLFKWIGTIDGAAGTVRGEIPVWGGLWPCPTFLPSGPSAAPVPLFPRGLPALWGYGSPLTPVPLDSHPQAYEELRYKLSLEFPSGYPYTAPTVRFLTPCYHPNVDTQGNICLDILKEKWSALYDVRTILLSIQSLLAGGSRG